MYIYADEFKYYQRGCSYGIKIMKAVICNKYGNPENLKIQDVEKPDPKSNELLIKVYASTVNRTDCAIIRAKPFIMRFITGVFKPKKIIPGTEFAGKIEAVGKDVKFYKVADKVFGFEDTGSESHAQYMTISENKAISLMPENITYEQAAASIEGVHYAYNMINKVDLKSGQKVLVNGATGAIGSAAVQILKYFGAYVTAVCNGTDVDLVKLLGADKVIDYTTDDFTKDDQIYSYVFDTVGKSSFAKCKPLLEPGGVYISSELGFMAQNLIFALLKPISGSKKVIFPIPLDCKGSITFISKLIEEEKFKTVIDRKYPMEKIVEAYIYVETGQKTGNVVIIM